MLELRGAIAAVRQGRNGRLFLGRQDGFDLDHFTGDDPFPDALVALWRATLAHRARALAARGIPYVVFIVPDAPSIHPEDLPDPLNADFKPLGERFIEAMGDIAGVTFVYPLAAMRQARGGLDIYKKKDSHWTTHGSYVAYRELMQALDGVVPCHIVPARDVYFTLRRAYGDLGSLTEPEQSEEIPIHTISGPEVTMVATMEGAGRQTCTEARAQTGTGPCRALFFRDSYMTDLSPYLARSFSNFLTIGTTTRVMLDAVDAWRADLVVSQVAERKLIFCESDHQLDSYATMFGGDFRTPSGAALLKALLLLGQDPAESARLIAPHADTLCHDPVHAFSAALICEANGDTAGAAAFAEAALADRPDQPNTLALAGRIALGAGRLDDAVRLTARAAEAAPDNGYFQELHVYCLVQAHDLAAAAAAVAQALDSIPDSANLWFWGSVCHDAMGDAAAARHCIRQALDLVPGEAAYLAQHARLTASRDAA
jgi:hypothetical protein